MRVQFYMAVLPEKTQFGMAFNPIKIKTSAGEIEFGSFSGNPMKEMTVSCFTEDLIVIDAIRSHQDFGRIIFEK